MVAQGFERAQRGRQLIIRPFLGRQVILHDHAVRHVHHTESGDRFCRCLLERCQRRHHGVEQRECERGADAHVGADAEREVRLALSRPDDRASLWMAPHHGSRTSSTPAWLNVLQPRRIIIQAGYRNHFGHPSPTVIARYRQRGIPWVASFACGAAFWRSDAPDAVRCWREEDRRYWRWQPDQHL